MKSNENLFEHHHTTPRRRHSGKIAFFLESQAEEARKTLRGYLSLGQSGDLAIERAKKVALIQNPDLKKPPTIQ